MMQVEITYTNPWIAKPQTLRLEIHIKGDDPDNPPGRRIGDGDAWITPARASSLPAALFQTNVRRR